MFSLKTDDDIAGRKEEDGTETLATEEVFNVQSLTIAQHLAG